MNLKTLTFILLLTAAWAPFVRTTASSQTLPAASTAERKLERRGNIRIRNLSGSITVTGWDRDVVRASAMVVGGKSAEVVFGVTPTKSLTISPAAITSPGAPARGSSRVNLDVSIPRDAIIELASTEDGNISLSNIGGAATVESGSGNVAATNVAALRVKSASGRVEVNRAVGAVTIVTGGSISATEIGGDLIAKATNNGGANAMRIRGLIDLSVVNGSVIVQDADTDVRVTSINGSVRVGCVKGRVEVGNINGSIALTNIGGDVDATTSNSPVEFSGAIHVGRRYQLKSHNATVEVRLPPDAPGFTATLSSYRGGMETDFPLTTQAPFSTRRLVGRYKDGDDSSSSRRTSIQLDSFNGRVKLTKAASATKADCRQ